MRSFDEYSFRLLFRQFRVVRERKSLPILSEPIIFRLKSKLPRRLYEELVRAYFRSSLAKIESRHRESWTTELPNRERWLLWLYEPTCRMFELRLQPKTRRWERLTARVLLREDPGRPSTHLEPGAQERSPLGSATDHYSMQSEANDL